MEQDRWHGQPVKRGSLTRLFNKLASPPDWWGLLAGWLPSRYRLPVLGRDHEPD